MKAKLALSFLSLVLASGAAAAASPDANRADGPELQSLAGTSLKCAVSPPTTLNYGDYCISTVPYSNYSVIYQVFVPGGGGPYSYAWTVPSLPRQSIYAGCNSTSSFCSLTVGRVGDHDNTITVTVTDPATGEHVTDATPYSTLATCYDPAFGWYFC